MVQTLWRTLWRFLKKLKIELPYRILLLGIYSEKNHNLNRCTHSSVYCSTIYNNQDMEASNLNVPQQRNG